jgi:hypothetical protein
MGARWCVNCPGAADEALIDAKSVIINGGQEGRKPFARSTQRRARLHAKADSNRHGWQSRDWSRHCRQIPSRWHQSSDLRSRKSPIGSGCFRNLGASGCVGDGAPSASFPKQELISVLSRSWSTTRACKWKRPWQRQPMPTGIW